MKQRKILFLSAFALMASLAIAGAGTASATVLCKTEASPCSTKYEAGTEIKAHLKAGTVAILETSVTKIECKQATVDVKVENAGGPTSTVSGPVSNISFGECNCPVTMLKNGSKEIHYIEGTHNGTVTGTGSQGTVNCPFGVDCVYGTNSTDLGVIIGGSGAVEGENIKIPRISGSPLCASSAAAKATFETVEPSSLYVSSS